MIDMNFHGIKAVDKYYLFDFPPKDGEYREGVQVVYETGYCRKKLSLIMVDSKKDSAYKLNIEDMAKSKTFLALLSDDDRNLVEGLSKLTENELSILKAEEVAHHLNDFMDMNWDQAIYDHAVNIDDWKPKKYQHYFTVWAEIKKNGKKTDYQLETFPSPHQALAYLNHHYQTIDGNMYIANGMSFID